MAARKPARKKGASKTRGTRKKSPAQKKIAAKGRGAKRKKQVAKSSSRKTAKKKVAARKPAARRKVAARKPAAKRKIAARQASPRKSLATRAAAPEAAPVKAANILPSAARQRPFEATTPSFLDEPTKPPSVTPTPSFGFMSPSMEPAEPEEE